MKKKLITITSILLLFIACDKDSDFISDELNSVHQKYFLDSVHWVSVNDKDSISANFNYTMTIEFYDISGGKAIPKPSLHLRNNHWETRERQRQDGNIEYYFRACYIITSDSSYASTKCKNIVYTLKDDELILYNAVNGYNEIKFKYVKDVYPWWQEVVEKDNPFYNGINYFIRRTQTDSTILCTQKYFLGQQGWHYESFNLNHDKTWRQINKESHFTIKLKRYLAPKTGEILSRWFTLSPNGKGPISIEYEYDQDKLTLYNYLDIDTQILNKTTETTEYPDRNLVKGTWSTVFSKDSVVLVFENNIMKSYTYDRNNPTQILNYKDLGEYKLENYMNAYQDIIIGEWQNLITNLELYSYSIENNRLTLKQNNVVNIYSKIK